MQFEQVTKEERVDLPRPSIDTGMGLERIAAVLQGEHDNYDIDLFKALIRASEDATGVRAEGKNRASHRVIADHLRASSFLIADGVLPSNEGRGYVLRRIMRRAMRHAQLLGAADPLMWRLVPALVREMGQAYPELVRGESLISETLKLEETRFRKTLTRGLGLLSEASEGLGSGDRLDGATAFKLYDTFGFPLDLTQDALRQRGVSVDLDGFNAAMARQKAEARANWAGSGEAATETVWFAVREKAGATEFLGYDTEEAEGIVLALVKDGAVVETAAAGDTVGIVVNQTPFYAESGGQMGDTGTISGDGFLVEVTDTQKKADGLFVHFGRVVKGTVKTGAAVELKVDHRAPHAASLEPFGHAFDPRGSARSARHACRAEGLAGGAGAAALRHLAQQDDHAGGTRRGRAHGQRDRGAEQPGHDAADERRRCARGRRDGAVRREVRRRGARRIDGHRPAWRQGKPALFGRAVRRDACKVDRRHRSGAHRLGQRGRGRRAPHRGADRRGGQKTSRRAGPAAEGGRGSAEDRAGRCAGAGRGLDRGAQEAREGTVRRAQETGARRWRSSGGNGAAENETVAGVGFLGKSVSGVAPKDLKSLADAGKSSLGSGVVVFVGASDDGKASVVVAVTEDLTKKFSAVDLVRVASSALGGQGGGGRPDMAQAGGPDASKADEAIAAVRAALEAA